ncbi:hypothetical protein [Streptobacillus moniliformis]|uniref:hypothetical protein n=1 Tax=Streptobacillus moniliformis TaxID=34105 RepID=UPI001E591399|nr:hypothetical protein [Streptobacillus moniliformis]
MSTLANTYSILPSPKFVFKFATCFLTFLGSSSSGLTLIPSLPSFKIFDANSCAVVTSSLTSIASANSGKFTPVTIAQLGYYAIKAFA